MLLVYLLQAQSYHIYLLLQYAINRIPQHLAYYHYLLAMVSAEATVLAAALPVLVVVVVVVIALWSLLYQKVNVMNTAK